MTKPNQTKPIISPEGVTYLNLGCGSFYFSEWNNIDVFRSRHVVRHDIRKGLPYPDASINVVYASHLLEHLSTDEAWPLLVEIRRVLRDKGIVRIVVPDLERICREYIRQLEAVSRDANSQNVLQYDWIKFQLLDQLVREQAGGKMIVALQSKKFDEEYVRAQCGDEFLEFYSDYRPIVDNRSFLQKLKEKRMIELWDSFLWRLDRIFKYRETDSRKTGEAHKWMYDSYSLKAILDKIGFEQFAVVDFDHSRIPYWDKYNLDKSVKGDRPRKPDSIFVEAVKP